MEITWGGIKSVSNKTLDLKHGFHLALTSGNLFWLTLVS